MLGLRSDPPLTQARADEVTVSGDSAQLRLCGNEFQRRRKIVDHRHPGEHAGHGAAHPGRSIHDPPPTPRPQAADKVTGAAEKASPQHDGGPPTVGLLSVRRRRSSAGNLRGDGVSRGADKFAPPGRTLTKFAIDPKSPRRCGSHGAMQRRPCGRTHRQRIDARLKGCHPDVPRRARRRAARRRLRRRGAVRRRSGRGGRRPTSPESSSPTRACTVSNSAWVCWGTAGRIVDPGRQPRATSGRWTPPGCAWCRPDPTARPSLRSASALAAARWTRSASAAACRSPARHARRSARAWDSGKLYEQLPLLLGDLVGLRVGVGSGPDRRRRVRRRGTGRARWRSAPSR